VADELELHFFTPGPPDQAMFRWRSQPPDAITGFELVDESFNGLSYERRYYDWPAYLNFLSVLGVLLRKWQQSIYKVSVRFDDSGTGHTRVTVVGKVDPDTRAALGHLADAQGGTHGLRVGA